MASMDELRRGKRYSMSLGKTYSLRIRRRRIKKYKKENYLLK